MSLVAHAIAHLALGVSRSGALSSTTPGTEAVTRNRRWTGSTARPVGSTASDSALRPRDTMGARQGYPHEHATGSSSPERTLSILSARSHRMTRPDPCLQLSIDVGHPAPAVFDGFTEPAHVSRWFTTRHEADVRPGGHYRNADGDCGTYVRVERPDRLEFTWDNPGHCPRTRVVVQFSPSGNGGTSVLLTHSGLQTPDQVEDMRGGWLWALSSFKSCMETGEPLRHEDWLACRARDVARPSDHGDRWAPGPSRSGIARPVDRGIGDRHSCVQRRSRRPEFPPAGSNHTTLTAPGSTRRAAATDPGSVPPPRVRGLVRRGAPGRA